MEPKVAQPETDARLRREYNEKGRIAKQNGKKREDCSVSGMLRGWWFEGWDKAEVKKVDESTPISINKIANYIEDSLSDSVDPAEMDFSVSSTDTDGVLELEIYEGGDTIGRYRIIVEAIKNV